MAAVNQNILNRCLQLAYQYERPIKNALIVYTTATIVDWIYRNTCDITIDLIFNYKKITINGETSIDIILNGDEEEIMRKCLDNLYLKGAFLGGVLAMLHNIYILNYR